ncbi:hypothetical protein Peur_006870 [Populus x canadensis]
MQAEEAQSSSQFQAPRPPDEQGRNMVIVKKGVGSSRFCSIDDLKRVRRFNTLALTDPTICGRSGGIWILWNDSRVSLKIIKSPRHLTHTQIDDGGGRVWFCTIVGSSFDEEQDGQKRYHDHQSGLRESVYMAVSDGTLFEKLLSWQAFQVA